jgi:hypothetical protein
MLAWTVPILPDRPLVGCAAFRMPIWGLYVLHPDAARSHGCCFRRTRWIPGVWVIWHSLRAAGLGLSVPGKRLTPVSFRHRLPRDATSLPRASKRAGVERGQGEVAVCVLLTHNMVRTRAAVWKRTSAPQKSSSH